MYSSVRGLCIQKMKSYSKNPERKSAEARERRIKPWKFGEWDGEEGEERSNALQPPHPFVGSVCAPV